MFDKFPENKKSTYLLHQKTIALLKSNKKVLQYL